jgi:hypothetical protein
MVWEGQIIILGHRQGVLVLTRVIINNSRIQMYGIHHHLCRKNSSQLKGHLKIYRAIYHIHPKIGQAQKRVLIQMGKRAFFMIDIQMEVALIQT